MLVMPIHLLPSLKVRSRNTFRMSVVLVLACLALAAGSSLFAAQTGSTSTAPSRPATGTATEAEPTQKKPRSLPFQGKIKAIDKAAATFTIGERTFIITAESKVMKRDKTTASLAHLTVGELVTGSYRKSEDGRLLINTLYIGPKEEAGEKAPAKTSPKKGAS